MRYFSIEELTESEWARRKGVPNVPSAREEAALVALVEHVLDPLRESIGRPLRITSGYRAPHVNAAIGGARGSQHTRGEAVDCKATGWTSADLALRVVSLGLPFDQLIAYAPSRGGHIHVSHRAEGNRGEVLHAPSAGGYVPGLPAVVT